MASAKERYTYPVILEPDEGTVLVTCPDIPSVVTFGDDEAAALHYAVDAITVALDSLMERGEPIPTPSSADGRPVVRLPILTAAKLGLYEAMREMKVSQAELARRLGVDPRQVRRMLDLTHRGRFEDIEAALEALGFRPVFAIERAA